MGRARLAAPQLQGMSGALVEFQTTRPLVSCDTFSSEASLLSRNLVDFFLRNDVPALCSNLQDLLVAADRPGGNCPANDHEPRQSVGPPRDEGLCDTVSHANVAQAPCIAPPLRAMTPLDGFPAGPGAPRPTSTSASKRPDHHADISCSRIAERANNDE